jgi:hypothetical protein
MRCCHIGVRHGLRPSSKNSRISAIAAKYTHKITLCGTDCRSAGAERLTLAGEIGSWPGVADWPANCVNTAPIACGGLCCIQRHHTGSDKNTRLQGFGDL